MEFAYDFQSRRVGKTVYAWSTNSTWSETSSTTFLYDGWNCIRSLITDNGSLITNSHIWGLDLSGSLQGAGGIGGLLAVVRPDPTNSLQPTAYLATYDANGNVSEYLADDGEIAAHFEYGPYGQAVVATGPLADEFPIRFSTKPFDLETGLGYWGYRYYHPDLGRWLSRDPIGEEGGGNLNGFVRNQCPNLLDLWGLAIWMAVEQSIGEREKPKVNELRGLRDEVLAEAAVKRSYGKFFFDFNEVDYDLFVELTSREDVVTRTEGVKTSLDGDIEILKSLQGQLLYGHDLLVYSVHAKLEGSFNGLNFGTVAYSTSTEPTRRVERRLLEIQPGQGNFTYSICFTGGTGQSSYSALGHPS